LPLATQSQGYDLETMVKNHAVSLACAGLIGLVSIACTAPIGSATPAFGPAQTIAGLPSTSAEDVGMSGERLGRLASAMEQLADERRLAGITTAVARHGKLAFFGTFGQRDIDANAPMSSDAIFRIYSMSKPITGVALMMLYEEGKFRLSDPVAMYIPEFANLQVAAAKGNRVEKASHPITIRELMTHTAGFTYGAMSPSSVDQMYLKKQVLAYDGTLRDMITRLAEIPLRHQPGTMWHYSVAVDVQGYLVEVLSGQKLDAFLQKRLFEPLNMVDTGFYVPKEKANRLAQIYAYGNDGHLIPPSKFDDTTQVGGIPIRSNEVVDRYLGPPTFLSGGSGLVSTAADYLRFAQMLLNGGELDGIRILAPLTVDLMRRNQLPREVKEIAPGVGFGLDFAVIDDPVAADGVSQGEYYWLGGAGTWFWIDPVEDLVFVGMIQQFGEDRPDLRSLSRRLTYQAILKRASTQ
jgi:CubicO group peptidase (beta-lactamase class C family)